MKHQNLPTRAFTIFLVLAVLVLLAGYNHSMTPDSHRESTAVIKETHYFAKETNPYTYYTNNSINILNHKYLKYYLYNSCSASANVVDGEGNLDYIEVITDCVSSTEYITHRVSVNILDSNGNDVTPSYLENFTEQSNYGATDLTTKKYITCAGNYTVQVYGTHEVTVVRGSDIRKGSYGAGPCSDQS